MGRYNMQYRRISGGENGQFGKAKQQLDLIGMCKLGRNSVKDIIGICYYC